MAALTVKEFIGVYGSNKVVKIFADGKRLTPDEETKVMDKEPKYFSLSDVDGELRFYMDDESVDAKEEQQPVVYCNGNAVEFPNRDRVRAEFTREELEKIYADHINSLAKQWGEDYIYTRWAREAETKNMTDWGKGKVVQVYSEEYTENSIDYADTYYSDGTVVTTNYGYCD